MKKLAFTTAIALALATGAYAQDHHGGGRGPGGGGGGAGLATHGSSMGGGSGPGPSSSFNVPRGASGLNMGANTMGPSHGPTGSIYNHAPTMNYKSNGTTFSKDRARFTDRGRHELYNRSDVDRGDRRNVERDHNFEHRGIARGDFFEHGRHFHFRRFWHGEWVFLNGWDDCAAWAWIHIAPGVWAWRPIDVCIG